MIGHKFGGSSVANAERISRVVDILLGRAERQVVVISAMQGDQVKPRADTRWRSSRAFSAALPAPFQSLDAAQRLGGFNGPGGSNAKLK